MPAAKTITLTFTRAEIAALANAVDKGIRAIKAFELAQTTATTDSAYAKLLAALRT